MTTFLIAGAGALMVILIDRMIARRRADHELLTRRLGL